MDDDARPTRQQISDAVDPAGWRLVLGAIYTEVSAPSLAEATRGGVDSPFRRSAPTDSGHLTVDIRADRAVLRLQSADVGAVTGRDVRLAHDGVRGAGSQGDGSRAPGLCRRSKSPSTRSTSRWCGRSGRRSRDMPTNRAVRICTRRWSTRPGVAPRSGSSRWMRRGRSAIGSTSTSTCRTRRPARIDAAIAAGGTPVVRRGGAGVLGAGRPRGQRGLHLYLAGTGLSPSLRCRL